MVYCKRCAVNPAVSPFDTYCDRCIKYYEGMRGLNTAVDNMRREVEGTGAVRDGREGKGRCDLLQSRALYRRIAAVLEKGAKHYGDRNWEKGMPVSWLVDSGLRHLLKFMAGQTDEDHLAMVTWNLLGALEMEEMVKDGIRDKKLLDIGAAGKWNS